MGKAVPGPGASETTTLAAGQQREAGQRAEIESTRGGSGKRSGGQPGHKGTTLRQTADPDHIATHRPPRCADGGQPLTAADSVGYARRPVFDVPPPRVEVTEYQAHTCECPAELFRDLHGVHLSAATLGALSRQAADVWRKCSERVRDLLAGADGAKHLDETRFRIAARAVAARPEHAVADVLPHDRGGEGCWRACGAAWCMTTGSRISRYRTCSTRCATRITCAT